MARALGDSLDGHKGAPISDIQDAKQDLCVPSDFVLKCTEEKGNVWEKRGLSLCLFHSPFLCWIEKERVTEDFNPSMSSLLDEELWIKYKWEPIHPSADPQQPLVLWKAEEAVA